MSYTITLGTSCLEITLDPVASNTTRLIPKSQIGEVKIDGSATLNIEISSEGRSEELLIDLTTISNQSTWNLGTLAANKAAITSFNTWLVVSSGGGGTGDASAANQVTGNNSLSTISTNGFVSTNNSTSTPLAISGVFTGTSEDITQYGFITVSVISNVASAIDGLSVQQSSDGTNWDISDNYSIPAATGKTFSIPRVGKFFRIIYTNGGTLQTSFRLQVMLTKYGIKPSSVRPQDSRTNDNDMEESLSYNMSYDPNSNTWSRMQTQDLYILGQGVQTAINQNISLAVSGTTSTDSIGYRMVSIQIVPTGTVSSGVVTFEGSNDNTTFVPLLLYDDASTTANPISTISPTTGVNRFFSGPLHFRYFRARISTIIGGGGSIQAYTILRQISFQPNIYTVTQVTASNLNVTATVASTTLTTLTPGNAAANLGKAEDAASASGDTGVAILAVRNDTLNSANVNATGDYIVPVTDSYGALLVKSVLQHKRTYSTSFTVSVAATATDIFQIIGSATTSVNIQKIILSGIQTTAGNILVNLIKRSTANSGGTSTSSVMISHQSTDAAATSVGTIYTANPTTGTPVGTIRSQYIPLGSVTSSSSQVEINFSERGKPIVLTGVAQALAVNINGVTITGGIIAVTVEFTEE